MKEPFWSEADLAYLHAHVGKVAFRRIAKKLGRSIDSVKLKAKRSGIHVSRMDAGNASDLAVLLGVDRHRILHWIERGWLEASRDVKGGVLRFTDSAIRSFLRDHGYALDLSRVEPAWLMRMAFGESEWRGDPRTCRYCDSLFYSRMETRVETVCAGCAARDAQSRRAA